jgi:molybdopterin-guanine dinucleotide biosynthesis protein
MEQRELDPIACFLTACEIERREHRAGRREHKVVNGRQISAEGGRFFYRFDFQGESDLREDNSVQVIVNDGFYQGTVKALAARSLTISLGTDLGPSIFSARLETQEQDLLQSLILRLKDLKACRDAASWNLDLAKSALNLNSLPKEEFPTASLRPADDLTPDQNLALARCMAQPVTYVWGPPGTGKTVLLAAMALQLYQANKRVLIVSHTNHAVDGVVESLCKRITDKGKGRHSVAEGSILRVGSLVKESLIKRYSDQVSLDAVINKSHEKVSQRLAALNVELSGVRDQLFSTSRALTLIDTHKQLREEIDRVRNSDLNADVGFISSLRSTLTDPDSRGYTSNNDTDAPITDLVEFMEESLRRVESEVAGADKEILNERTLELSARQLELTEAIAVLEKFIRDLRLSLLDRARIIATTATHAMLSVKDLSDFDAVLIDEASMLPLPLSFLLCARARERVVIAGDFRQLPAIVRSDSPTVQQWYGRDIFDCAGVIDLVDSGKEHPSVVPLTTQFRSHEVLCGLINNRFYNGLLKTKTDSSSERYIFRDPLAYLNRSPVVLVDTSEIAPCGEIAQGSKSNLQHALVVRKLALLLSAHGVAVLPEALGVIVPYRAQADLVRSLLDECVLGDIVSVGTVHKFQGSEREAIILDLTESVPHKIGRFLNPNSLRDTGARLLNVALSRARRHLIVVANLKHLRSQLKMRSLMWGILDDLERVGYRLSVSDLINERIFSTPSREACESPGLLAFQAFEQSLFMPALVADLIDARSEVVFSTTSINERCVTITNSVLEEGIKRGLKVSVRYDERNMRGHDSQVALNRLRRAGVATIAVDGDVKDMIVIDSEVVWSGSLAPLDALKDGDGVMTRVVSGEAALRALYDIETEPRSPMLRLVGA